MISISMLMNSYTLAGPLHGFDNAVPSRYPPQNTIIVPRGSMDLGSGWSMFYDTWAPLLPSSLSSAALGSFFETISEQAKGAWLDRGPQHYLEVEKGALEIEFYSALQPLAGFSLQDSQTLCVVLQSLGLPACLI